MKNLVLFLMATLTSCMQNQKNETSSISFKKGSFGYDLHFLKTHHKDLLVLEDDQSGAQIIVLPAYQGRVMTSTVDGNEGTSFGWVNHELIASGKPSEHISPFGGEERFWLGPEGGQFSIYFKKGVDFTFDNWFVPKEIDTESFKLTSVSKKEANFEKEMLLENYSGNQFDLKVNRNIKLLDKASIEKILDFTLPNTSKVVGFKSENIVTNQGKTKWDKNSGMLSIWILSMLNADEKTTVAIPYKQGDDAILGKIVTDDYFGKVPGERLKINEGLLLFKADSKYRAKIGVSPKRALPLVASYDALHGVLTFASFTLPKNQLDYVNSMWEIQEKPFEGDAINAYNDGLNQGKQLGKFYEIESSSPAAVLAPGESIEHSHSTIHIKGSHHDLNKISLKLLGVGIDDIQI